RAAQLRDQQKKLQDELDALIAQWQSSVGKCVKAEDIAAVVSGWTGIPVTSITEDESSRLLRLESELHKRVIGQDEAVTAVSRAIRRGRVGLKDPKRPIGSFLFLGPTGVGKTELCKALAEVMFGDESAIFKLDMSEYMERHTVSKLIGSPPGYVGYDDGGQLTEKVRRKPYCVILFDEIEKAHEDVFNILLQIMEDGVLTDSQGRKVDFKNAVVVMTSNAGAKNITEKTRKLGFSFGDSDEETSSYADIKSAVMADLRRTFKPEFLNRIDDIIVFRQLTQSDINSIAGNMLRVVGDRVKQAGMDLEFDDDAAALLAEKGFDPVYGARPLRRVIQSELEDSLAEMMLDGSVKKGDKVAVSAKDGRLEISVKEPVTV
ncbi:MAG: AAA family ATPase, partial [Oscillospiraceae bacterium]|nr:AAA family ATPase [Oscillospiraceae bacterium]